MKKALAKFQYGLAHPIRSFRKPRTHLVKVRPGDTLILMHNGTAWRALMLQEVTTRIGQGTTATFTSVSRHMKHSIATSDDKPYGWF